MQPFPILYPLFVVVGPTAVGKTTLMDAVFARRPNLRPARSWTSRPRREREPEDARFFVSQEVFKQMIAEGRFLEWAQPFLNDALRPSPDYYGRTVESFAGLELGPCLCDMTEHGVATFQRLFDRSERVMTVIRIEGVNMVALERRDERASSDAARAAEIDILVHHTVTSDHAKGGLERAVTALLKIIDDTLRDHREHLEMLLMGQ
jgi:guanylate kinase